MTGLTWGDGLPGRPTGTARSLYGVRRGKLIEVGTQRDEELVRVEAAGADQMEDHEQEAASSSIA